jgi:hypothetical protein
MGDNGLRYLDGFDMQHSVLLNAEASMSKTITIRLDNDTYKTIKSAAQGRGGVCL